MATARPVIPGSVIECTRQCHERRHLLAPTSQALIDAILYCWAVGIDKYGALLHALVLLMTHEHVNLTDVLGNRPELMKFVHELIARCVKAYRCNEDGSPMRGPVWDPTNTYGCISDHSHEAIVEGLAYTMANPVEAGLCSYPDQFVGFVSKPRDMLGKTITLKRPACLPDTYPETATLRFTVPEQYKDNPQAFVAEVQARLDAKCRDARARRRAEGKSVPNPKKLRRIDPMKTPATPKVRSFSVPRFRAVTREAANAARKAWRAWQQEYRAAFLLFQAGVHSVTFPAGTWWHVKYAGVTAAPLERCPLLDW